MLSKNQVNEIRGLHTKKQRSLSKRFIVEGVKTVLEVLQYRPQILSHLYGTQEFASQHAAILKPHQSAFTLITSSELARISIQQNPNQVMAVCENLNASNLVFDFESGFSLYLDEIRDPGNFGTLLRLAEWYGITKVFCSESTCELYNPKVIQASMGAFLRVEIVYTSLSRLISENAIQNVYGAMLNGSNLYKASLKRGLIVIGNEANGISKENLVLIKHPITIPAAPGNHTESLNAAMAAGIICSEFFRQLGPTS